MMLRTMEEKGVEVRNIFFNISSVPILKNVSINIPRGSIYGLLGPSGCGKTTLLKCIVGSYIARSGEVNIFGGHPGDSSIQIPGPGIGYMPQDVALYDFLTIKENIIFFGIVYGLSYEEIKKRTKELLTLLNLPDKNRRALNLSGGEKRRLSLCVSIIHRPPFVILDEPTVGVDPILRRVVWDYLFNFSRVHKSTIIITTHYIEEARKCDVVGFMRKGRIICENEPRELMAKYSVNTLEAVFYEICKAEEPTNEDEAPPEPSVLQKIRRKMESVTDISFKSKAGFKRKAKTFADIKNWFFLIYILLWKSTLANIRYPGGILVQIGLPISIMVVIGVLVGPPPFGVKLGIVNEDRNPILSNLFIKNINNFSFDIIPYDNLSDALQDIKTLDLWGVVHIKPNFTDVTIARLDSYVNFDSLDKAVVDQSVIEIRGDMVNRFVAIASELSLMYSYKNFTVAAVKELQMNPRLAEAPVDIGEAIYGGLKEYFDMRSFILTGTMVFALCAVCLASVAFVMTEELHNQIFHRSLVAGVTAIQIFSANIISCTVIMFVSMLAIFIMAFVVFQIKFYGSLLLMGMLLSLVSINSALCGMVVSCVTKTPMATLLSIICAGLALAAVGGTIWPFEALPVSLRWTAWVNPVAFPTASLGAIIQKGLDITHPDVWSGFAYSSGSILFYTVINIVLLKYKAFD